MADADRRQSVSEPYVDMEVFCPKEYTGTLMELAESRRGEYKDMTFLTEERVSLKYALPLAEVITDFFDAMKSRSKGYASMEYSVSGYRPNDLVRLDILIAGEEAPPLSAIVHRDAAHGTGKASIMRVPFEANGAVNEYTASRDFINEHEAESYEQHKEPVLNMNWLEEIARKVREASDPVLQTVSRLKTAMIEQH